MVRPLALAAAVCLVASSAPAEIAPAKSKPKATKKAPKNPPADAAQPTASAKTGEGGTPAGASQTAGAAASPDVAKPPPVFDQEEFRRQVMEEVRRELQKTKDEVKQETAWVEQDSQARVQDSEAVEQLKQRVNLFQPHGYLRLRSEFFNNMNLGRGTDPTGHTLFLQPFIGSGGNNSQSDANFRFRFEPTLEVSEDLAIYGQLDVLDNILLGTDPVSDVYIDPNTPLASFANTRGAGTVKVKRLWGRVNTQLGELVFGRMGYHWGLGILHNDGNCLDCDYGDTYDRIAFAPREIKGHRFALMFDLLDKGAVTTGEHGELGRSVDIDTLDDGYRLGLEITRLDNAEEIKRKLDAGRWVINYGILGDYRTQVWDTPVTTPPANGNLRSNVVRRGAKLYQPDFFLALKRKKWRFDAEVAMTYGSVNTHQPLDFDPATVDPQLAAQLMQPINFLQFGGALQTDIALLAADALLVGLEFGGASGDKGAYGFGARPWRSGSGAVQPTLSGGTPLRAAGPGDIDGTHLDYSNLDATHGRMNNFVFNRAFNVDMILWRNLVTSVTSGWYLKPSIRYRPTGRKTGGGDDTGFEILAAIIYSQAWYAENTPSAAARPLGIELNVGITYDTSDRFHAGLAYGALLPLSGLNNTATGQGASLAHAIRLIMAIPF
ncbi:MAG: TIGR04551 family protein [Deltaproteobacteria bacterium]|nr:MAG: TIGR04551 family protein [Deltaproteobacteria bacterium]